MCTWFELCYMLMSISHLFRIITVCRRDEHKPRWKQFAVILVVNIFFIFLEATTAAVVVYRGFQVVFAVVDLPEITWLEVTGSSPDRKSKDRKWPNITWHRRDSLGSLMSISHLFRMFWISSMYMLINKISHIRWTISYNDTQCNYRVVIKGFIILILKYATSELCCYDCSPSCALIKLLSLFS
jgi:hypothetical protein